MKIEYKFLNMDEEHMKEYEEMRLEAFDYGHLNKLALSQTRYTKAAQENKRIFVVVGLYYEEELDAIVYVSNNHNSLYIEQLFVRKNKQGKHLHLGRQLLQYILENKETFEQYFNQHFEISSLTPIDEKSIAIYKSFGYQKKNGIYGIYSKHI